MALSQETETIETILESLGLEHLFSSFHEADIDVKLLMDASDEEVKDLLTDINFTPGNRLRIMKKINKLKTGRPLHPEATSRDHVESKSQSSAIENLNIRPDLSSNAIQLVTNGEEVCIQIGEHNICHLNIDISNELQTEEESGSTNDEGDLVQMTLRMHTASSSGICIAFLEGKMLQGLSGDQREEINKVLREKFGVEIIVCKKGSVVLVLRKIKPISKGLEYKKTQLDFLSTLFELLGFSNKHPSEINLQVQLKSGNDTFNESQLKEKGLQLILSPRKTIARMANEDQKKLVSCLLLKTIGSNLGDNSTSELQIKGNLGIKIPNHTEGCSKQTEMKDHFESIGHSYESTRSGSSSDDDNADSFGSPQIDIASKVPLYQVRRENTKDEIRVALIGKTGSGKSATGNTLLNKKPFPSIFSLVSVTKRCSQGFANRFGKKIVVVDTPGIFDTELTNEETQQEIAKCIGITSPGPHAFILVLSLGRFTEEEQKTVDHFVKCFGDTVYQYFIVLFTRKDELEKHNMTLEQHLAQVPKSLKSFIEKCGNRTLAFNNELKGEQSEAQVKELLTMIETNVERNGGNCYTNEAYIQAEIQVKKMEEKIVRKARKEAEEKLKALRESEDKPKAKAEEEDVLRKLREKEENARNDARHEIEERGFLPRAWSYIRSWLPF